MHGFELLADLVVILVSAIAVTLLSHRVRLAPLVGLMITGALIGPAGLGWVSNRSAVEVYAEVGILFLLFTIGLELSLERLRELWPPLRVGGTLQMAGTGAVVAAGALVLGASPTRAALAGLLIALSSTAVVLKMLADRRETDTPQGRVMLAILVFQDLLVVPALLVVPVLGQPGGALGPKILGQMTIAVLLLGAGLLVARFVVPRALGAIARMKAREIFVLGSVAACLGLGLLAARAGFSLALGGFLAGIILARSEWSHQVAAEVAPIRDLFNSLFFISVGMLLSWREALARFGWVALLLVTIWVVKIPLAALATRATRRPLRTALMVGLGLGQVGEFSFILGRLGEANGLVTFGEMQVFLAASILSIAATPLLFWLGERLPERWFGAAPPAARAGSEERRDHVLVLGWGVAGRNLTRVLSEASIRYVVVELDPDLAAQARQAGATVVLGDASRREILEHAGAARARVAVFALSDLQGVRRALRQALDLRPDLHTIVRTRRVAELEDLYRAGANEVIAEEFETSIEIFNRVLRRYRVPRNVVEAQERLLRGERYAALRSGFGSAAVPEQLLRALAAGTTDIFRIDEDCAARGQTLQELDLRRRSAAMVIAVVRGETSYPNPPADLRLEAGDTVVLVGSHTQIDTAFRLLQGPPGAAA